jgi:hypothetical protein
MGAKESIMTTIAKIMEEIEANTWAGIADELKARYGGEVADYEEYEWDVGGNPIVPIMISTTSGSKLTIGRMSCQKSRKEENNTKLIPHILSTT